MISDKCVVLGGHSQSHSVGLIEGGRSKQSGPFVMMDACSIRVTLGVLREPVGV